MPDSKIASVAVLGVTADLEVGIETRYRARYDDGEWTLVDRDDIPASVCKRPRENSEIPAARRERFGRVLEDAHAVDESGATDATFERASELATDGGVSETERLDRAVREAATLIDAGDSERSAIGTAAMAHRVEHRRDDVHQRVCARLGRRVMTDGGHAPEDLVVAICEPCEFHTVVGYGAISATSCHHCEGDLEVDPERTAHRCPEIGADHVIVPTGDECRLCGEVQKPPVVTDGGDSGYTCDLCEDEYESVGAALECCSEVPLVVKNGGAVTSVLGPEPTAFEQFEERGRDE